MAGTHRNFQDLKAQKGLTGALEIMAWTEIVSELQTREHIYIENTGVSDVNTAAHLLAIRFFQGSGPVNGEPLIFLAQGESWEGDLAAEVRIAVRSNILNGSWSFIETENIIRKGPRDYDME